MSTVGIDGTYTSVLFMILETFALLVILQTVHKYSAVVSEKLWETEKTAHLQYFWKWLHQQVSLAKSDAKFLPMVSKSILSLEPSGREEIERLRDLCPEAKAIYKLYRNFSRAFQSGEAAIGILMEDGIWAQFFSDGFSHI